MDSNVIQTLMDLSDRDRDAMITWMQRSRGFDRVLHRVAFLESIPLDETPVLYASLVNNAGQRIYECEGEGVSASNVFNSDELVVAGSSPLQLPIGPSMYIVVNGVETQAVNNPEGNPFFIAFSGGGPAEKFVFRLSQITSTHKCRWLSTSKLPVARKQPSCTEIHLLLEILHQYSTQ